MVHFSDLTIIENTTFQQTFDTEYVVISLETRI